MHTDSSSAGDGTERQKIVFAAGLFQVLVLFTWHTLHSIRVSSKELVTGADATVIGGPAAGMESTVTWIHTNLPLAVLSCGTVWICQALVRQALNVGVALVLWDAVAQSPVRVDPAFRILSAGVINQTGVLALSVDACHVKGTLGVPLATS